MRNVIGLELLTLELKGCKVYLFPFFLQVGSDAPIKAFFS